MYQNWALENLEIKLQNAKQENAEVFEQVESDYKQNYKDFVDGFFKTDVLGAKKSISALFQLEAFNGSSKEKSLEIALEKWLKILPLKLNQKEQLKDQILQLSNKREKFSEIFENNSDFSKDYNYPVLEDLLAQKVLNKADMLSIYSWYQNTWDIRLSLWKLPTDKREVVTSYFYSLNSSKREERISWFSDEYSWEIAKMQKQFDWPIVDWVVSFVWRNFFKMKPYKKKIESKKLRLRRTFKVALLKLLRIKYSGFNVEKLIKQIDSLDDFESMFRLLQKLIDVIPENGELLEKYSIQEQVDEVEEAIIESEWNKEKILAWEEITVKACTLINDTEQKLDRKTLDKILDDDTDIVWDELKFRKIPPSQPFPLQEEEVAENWWNLLDWGEVEEVNAWILAESNSLPPEGGKYPKGDGGFDDEETKEEIIWEEELAIKYNELKTEYNILEKKKQNIFASWDFDMLDEINEEILSLMVKLEKVTLLIGEDN